MRERLVDKSNIPVVGLDSENTASDKLVMIIENSLFVSVPIGTRHVWTCQVCPSTSFYACSVDSN